jgi:hypothetical protein
MFFQIKELVLWPKDESKEPRRVSFAGGRVNVISGASKTGKSAIVPIIDYCLGADKCAIPVGPIRDACAWFGIVVSTVEGEKLLARREPGGQRSTGDMFISEDARVNVPRIIEEKNASVEDIKRRLDELAGLTNLSFDFDATGANNFKSRPSFRDMVAFCFQPQNLIANQDVLFYKADSYEHREKLRTIFPYVLGAITPTLLAKRFELETLRRELRVKERELAGLQQATTRWLSDLRTYVSAAREYGLTKANVSADATADEMVGILRELRDHSSRDAAITPESINDSIAEYINLERRETIVATQLAALRRRSTEMTRLRDSAEGYITALRTQRDRLSLVEWLRGQNETKSNCPLCQNHLAAPSQELEALASALAETDATSARFKPSPDAFEKEFQAVRAEIRHMTEHLEGLRKEKKVLSDRSRETQQAAFKSATIDRFLGRLEQALGTYEDVSPGSDLIAEVAELKQRVQALAAEVSEAQVARRVENALRRINQAAGGIVPTLDAERPNDPVSLSPQDLAIKVAGSGGREDFLWEIGSGANWLAYHVAMTLALQHFFIAQPESPVPAFLVYDQPSQVYFPRRVTRGDSEPADPNWGDEDVAAVRKVFEALGSAAHQVAPKLQIIVLDHAGSDVWGDINDVALTEEWRGGEKLVPPSWLR